MIPEVPSSTLTTKQQDAIAGHVDIKVNNGIAGALPGGAANVAYVNVNNNFSIGQTINGALSVGGNLSCTAPSTVSVAFSCPGTPGLAFQRSKAPAANDISLYIQAQQNDNSGNLYTYGDIYVSLINGTVGAQEGAMFLRTAVAGAIANRIGIGAAGVTIYGTLSAPGSVNTGPLGVTGDINVSGGVGAASIYGSGAVQAGNGLYTNFWVIAQGGGGGFACAPAGQFYIRPNGTGNANFQAYLSTAGKLLVDGGYMCRNGYSGGNSGNCFNIYYNPPNATCWIDNTNVGVIASGSDYRIKKDVTPLPSTWKEIQAMRPVSFTWADFKFPDTVDERDGLATPGVQVIGTDELQWGFIAHQVQEDLLASAAHGKKDEENLIQSLNLAPILAATVRALQEAMGRIEILEARLEDLAATLPSS